MKQRVSLIFLFLLFIPPVLRANPDSISGKFIKVHFLYGSKPQKEFKNEPKYFGGLHGGHVTIECNGVDYGFNPRGKYHVFPHKKERHSFFATDTIRRNSIYPEDCKTVSFIIPVSGEQIKTLKEIFTGYINETPYDYAFFGVRCAAATYEVLSQVDLVKKKSKCGVVMKYFYPKPLRKKFFKLAKKNNYEIITTEGRPTRIWEKD